MKVACPYCHQLNLAEAINCQFCQKSLSFSAAEIDLPQLKTELQELKRQFSVRYDALQERIVLAEKQLNFLQEKNLAEKVQQIGVQTPLIHKTQEEKIIPPIIEEKTVKNPTIDIEKSKEKLEEKVQENIDFEAIKRREQERYEQQKRQQEEAEWLRRKKEQKRQEQAQQRQEINETLQNFFTTNLVGTFFAPLAQFWGYLQEVYELYKSKNQLPVFFMTLGGLLAILLGFGYLMQFISDYTFEIIKISGSVVAGFGLIGIGAYLHQKDEKYHDFGSALQGLGVSINYLIIYFLAFSEFFTFFNQSTVSFVLILLNTLIASYLAVRYETKVVLIISLFGGAFAPFYLQSTIISVIYFVYLWLLCLLTVVIALRLKWRTGGTLAFLVATVVFEFVILGGSFMNFLPLYTLTVLSMAFAYLFFYFTLFENKQQDGTWWAVLGTSLKETLTPQDIFTLASNGAVLVINLYNIYDAKLDALRPLSYIYLANAALWLAGFFVFRQSLTYRMQFIFMILAGAFLGFAAPYLFERNVAGLFWSVEGLALILCGYVFENLNVRREGYFILILGIAKIVFTFPDIWLNWQVVLWTDGFINLLSLGFVLIALKLLIDKYATQSNDLELQIRYVVHESLSFWLVAICWTILQFYFPVWSFNLSLVAVYGLLAWSYHQNLVLTRWVAFLHLGFLVWAYLLSVQITGNLIFRFQTRPAQIAAVELFLSLWFLQFFYEKVLPMLAHDTLKKTINKDAGFQTTFVFREIFYLAVPLLLLPSVQRFYPQYMPLALWVAVFLAFIVAELSKKKLVKVELHILLPIATIGLFQLLTETTQDAAYLGQLQTNTLISGLASVALLVGVTVYDKGFVNEGLYKQNPENRFWAYHYTNSYLFYHLIAIWILLVLNWNNRLFGLAILVPTLYIGVVMLLHKKVIPLFDNYKLFYRLGTFLLVFSALGYFISSTPVVALTHSTFIKILLLVFVVACLLVYGFIAYSKEKHYPMDTHQLPIVWTIDLYLVHSCLVLVYMGVFRYLYADWTVVWFTITLTLHAIVLLFNSAFKTYKTLLNLSIAFFALAILKLYFLDMLNYTTKDKVIVFMGIGVMMLVGSYLFMKVKEKIQGE